MHNVTLFIHYITASYQLKAARYKSIWLYMARDDKYTEITNSNSQAECGRKVTLVWYISDLYAESSLSGWTADEASYTYLQYYLRKIRSEYIRFDLLIVRWALLSVDWSHTDPKHTQKG